MRHFFYLGSNILPLHFAACWRLAEETEWQEAGLQSCTTFGRREGPNEQPTSATNSNRWFIFIAPYQCPSESGHMGAPCFLMIAFKASFCAWSALFKEYVIQVKVKRPEQRFTGWQKTRLRAQTSKLWVIFIWEEESGSGRGLFFYCRKLLGGFLPLLTVEGDKHRCIHQRPVKNHRVALSVSSNTANCLTVLYNRMCY